MLPVQTVMIRYMVLVYRWGSGRLGSAGARGGFVGGSMMGGGARRWAVATGPGRAKAPPTWSRRGLLGVSATWLIFPAPSQIHLEVLQAHSRDIPGVPHPKSQDQIDALREAV